MTKACTGSVRKCTRSKFNMTPQTMGHNLYYAHYTQYHLIEGPILLAVINYTLGLVYRQVDKKHKHRTGKITQNNVRKHGPPRSAVIIILDYTSDSALYGKHAVVITMEKRRHEELHADSSTLTEGKDSEAESSDSIDPNMVVVFLHYLQ